MEGLDEQQKERRLCECGREAVEKVAGPRSPNQGLRYLCCDRFVFFGKRKDNSCRFFVWIDQPRITKEQKKEAQALKSQRKEAALQPADNTENIVEGSEIHLKNTENLQLNAHNIELEIRNDFPQARTHEDAVNAAVDSSVGAQDSLIAKCRQDVYLEEAALLIAQAGNEERQQKKRRLCECGREAVEKVAGPRSPNQGLRYRCCDHFVFFGKKKDHSCRFFEWIDQPRITKEQKKEAQALKSQRKEVALQPANNTENVIERSEIHSKTTENLQLNAHNIELEIRNDFPQAQTHEDAANAATDSSVGAQDSLIAKCRQDVYLEEAALLIAQAGNEERQPKKRRLCECGREAVEKVAGPRSPNQGLRYLCCDLFIFFGKKKDHGCRFFEWIDQPRITKEQNKEAQALKSQRKEAAHQPANNAESVVEGSKIHSKTTENLQLNGHNLVLEIRNGFPQAQTHEDAVNAAVDSSVGAQDSLIVKCRQDVCLEEYALLRAQAGNGEIDGCLGAEQQQSSPTHAIKCETNRSNLKDTIQPNTQAGHDAHADADSDSLHEKGFTTANQDDTQTLANAPDILETPTCSCSRAALLKTAVKSRGPNKGLRFWVCSNSRPFYVKKKSGIAKNGEESCKFFRWVDTPNEKSDVQKDEEKQRRKENRKKKELSVLSYGNDQRANKA